MNTFLIVAAIAVALVSSVGWAKISNLRNKVRDFIQKIEGLKEQLQYSNDQLKVERSTAEASEKRAEALMEQTAEAKSKLNEALNEIESLNIVVEKSNTTIYDLKMTIDRNKKKVLLAEAVNGNAKITVQESGVVVEKNQEVAPVLEPVVKQRRKRIRKG